MNKKGFLKILEAIIALVIIFGAVIFLLPKTRIQSGEVPHELELTSRAILDAVQNNPEFRKSVLTAGTNEDAFEKINDEILKILPTFSPWAYAFSICDTTQGCDSSEDNYINENGNLEQVDEYSEFLDHLPSSNIYAKAVYLSKKDVTSHFTEREGENKLIRIYFWEK